MPQNSTQSPSRQAAFTSKWLKDPRRFSHTQLLVFAVFFAAVGGFLLYKSFALNPNLPGDVNNDNTVNITDLSILLSNYNQNYQPADFNSDGTVNVIDMSILLSNYGMNNIPSTPTVSLAANPASITSGSSSILSWSSINATSCAASGAWSGTKATSGTQSVSPTVTSTYSLTCTGPGGSINASTIVTVTTGGEVAPARATTIDCRGGSYDAANVKNDTRYIDCTFTGDLNLAMNGKQRITIIGDQMPVTQLRGVNDIWIEGRPDAYMNSGPRTDGGDLLQIKRWPYNDSGAIASNITLRWIRFHDNTRPAGSSAHPDGIQVFSGRNIRILSIRMERVDVQGIFVNDAGPSSTGGGPLENFLVADSYIEKPPTGYYTVIYGGEVINGIVRNVREGANSRLSPTCYNAGQCKAENMMDLNGNPIKGYTVG